MSCSGDLTFYFWWIIVLPLGHISDRWGHRHPAGEKSAFYLFFCFSVGSDFFSSVGLCFFPLVKSPLLASRTLRVFLNWIFFLLNRTKNRLDVSAQFFRDGKLKHRCVRYSDLFARTVVFCSFPSFKHLHEKSKNKQANKQTNKKTVAKMTKKQSDWYFLSNFIYFYKQIVVKLSN